MEYQYKLLTDYINIRLDDARKERIFFDGYFGLKYDIYFFPVSMLINISEDEFFLRECYFKILDRPIDLEAYEHLKKYLSNNGNRLVVINGLLNSEERKLKKTSLSFQ